MEHFYIAPWNQMYTHKQNTATPLLQAYNSHFHGSSWLLPRVPFPSSLPPSFFPNVDFLYNGFQHAANLSLDASASILRGGALQLTNDSNNLMGHAFDSPV
jgi:hypothetical protein